MPSKVTLKIVAGALAGKEYGFEERTACIIGRSGDCHLRIPTDAAHEAISRHHCLLDVNPPDVCVRDFGSLNGTWVNGKKIGQREENQTPEEGALLAFPEYDLKDGDKIQLGATVFGVAVHVPRKCSECAREIPDDQKAVAEVSPGAWRCEPCREKAKEQTTSCTTQGERTPSSQTTAPVKNKKACVKCGKDVSAEMGAHRDGDYVCRSCQANPLEILRHLLKLAQSGQEEVAAIRGYTILRELGKGGMGAVYLAKHEGTGEQVALKVLLPQVAADEKAKTDFLRETENTRALRHPNVVQLRDSGCANGAFYFTLEFCDGGCVHQMMKQRGEPLAVDDATEIVLQALDGLEYAHHAEIPYVKLKTGKIGFRRGLVHRDIKPANIFLCGAGRSRIAKVADFGLAKAFETAGLTGRTGTGMVAGTPVFMARQQVLDFKCAKPDVDVWAMAASLYFMLTGALVRDFRGGVSPMKLILQDEAAPIRQRKSSIPAKLAEVIDEALRESPALKFKSAAEFKKALEESL
ncbi:MAG: protein kinase [Verrucomicrobia bacterium]|nr:protein kinase [Verrucomicrobiota bacterium]